MKYRYRVRGNVEKAFILRGAHFRIGSEIFTFITEEELAFIKDNCTLTEVEDFENTPSVSQDPIPTTKTTKSTRGRKVAQDGVSLSTSGADKDADKATV